MQKKIFPLLFIVYSTFSYGQDVFCKQVSSLKDLIQTSHYKPKPVNDSLSKHVQKLFLNQLDPEKDFFLQSDIADFKKEEFKLDDYLMDNDCEFINKYTAVLKDRVNDTKETLQALKKIPINYNGKHTLQYIPDSKGNYFTSKIKQQTVIEKRVGFLVLKKLLETYKTIEKITPHFKTSEADIKLKIIQNELCLLEELQNRKGGLDNFVKEAFLDALVKYNDPNSSFLNESNKTTYQNELATNQLSFGIITTKKNNGDIVITNIIPGSVAFKTGKFEVNDIIKSLQTPTSRLETYCISNDDIIEYTNKKGNETIIFSILKENGTTQEIELTKSKIKVDDNVIRGYIIENTIGYIKIPSFYTNLESPNKKGLTHDFSKELYKLQREKIEGLIIDLRFNGGGSMQEAIDLSGMFIDRGPVSIIKNNTGEIFTLKDSNRGQFYSKPLLILVNEYSASASEFFSSVMQDYNRAIIAGSKTYGKSSAQSILPLSKTENLGFCKLTLEAFYRVDGTSHQSKGIQPDITLPSQYSIFKNQESDNEYALLNDTITPNLLHRPNPRLNLKSIRKKSQERITNQKEFQNIITHRETLSNRIHKKGKIYNLTLQNVKEESDKRKKIIDDFFHNNENKYLSIENTKSTNEFLTYNTSEKELNINLVEDLSKDIYINEAYLILIDFLNTN